MHAFLKQIILCHFHFLGYWVTKCNCLRPSSCGVVCALKFYIMDYGFILVCEANMAFNKVRTFFILENIHLLSYVYIHIILYI